MSVVPVDRSDLAALLETARVVVTEGVHAEDAVETLSGIIDRYRIDYVVNPDDNKLPQNAEGNVAADEVSLNIGDVKVTFLDDVGDELEDGQAAHQNLALVEVDGLDPRRVMRAEFDDIDYSSDALFRVRLTLLPKIPVLEMKSG